MKNILYFLLLALIIVVITIVIINIKNNRVPQEKYQPFAFLPEINLSESPNFVSENVVAQTLGLVSPVINQEMLHGQYQRYPLNRKRQTTSVVAVSATQDNPKMIAWLTQTSADTWNFVWPDPASYYWTTVVDVHACPVVVVKGKYPRCRYFGFFPYTGFEAGDNGKMYVGQGINQTWSKTCNATIPNDCAGLLDQYIEPDPGSKNPFTDPSYKDGDDNFYTVYFISPYYKGKLPQSKNILPLTIFGLNQSIILYRIYAPFNPKGCNFSIYSSQMPFSTKGCDNTKFSLQLNNESGGSVNPKADSSSPCETKDKVCIQQCVNQELAKTMDPDCYQYVNNNKYCLCEPENYYGQCGQYMEKVIRKCSNGMGGLSNYCEGRPALNPGFEYCVDQMELNPEIPILSTGIPDCPNALNSPKGAYPANRDYECEYVRNAKLAECATAKLFQSTNPDCQRFKDPANIQNIIKEDPTKKGTCANDFAKILGECYYDCKDGDKRVECTLFGTGAAWIGYKNSVEEAQKDNPAYAYQPEYDFVEYPKQCEATCNRFTCTNGFCVPDIHGEYDEPTCGGQCTQVTPPPTGKPHPHRYPYGPTRKPFPTPRVVREGYEMPTTVPGEECVNKFKASACDRGTNPYQNVSDYFVNAQNETLFASSGWVGLPDVFVKYSYNNYFVRLNNSDQVAPNTLRNLFSQMKSLVSSVKISNDANPSNPFEVVSQNDEISIGEYVQYIQQAEQQKLEMYQAPKSLLPPIPPIPPMPTGHPYPTRHPKTKRVKEDLCPTFLDRKTYLQIGTQYPKTNYPSFDTSTVSSPGPGCSYYADYCACEHNGKKNAPPCNILQRGFTDCKGNPCFTKWGLQSKTNVVFDGEAHCFSISGNTGETIIFPNPDAQYIACATVYDPESVYVIWMDVPSTPLTPSYSNLLQDKYDMRYWSLGHYYWAMGLLNQRPALSGIFDQGFHTVKVQYNDDKYGNCLQSQRVCVVLATYDQREYLKTYQLLDERVNWLNWGKLSGLNLQTPPESPPPYPVDVDNNTNTKEGFRDFRQEYMNSKFASAADNAERVGVDLGLVDENERFPDRNLKGLVKKVVPKKIPMEGMIILRQLRAKESFTPSIANYVNSNPQCLSKTIPLEQSKAQEAAYPPTMVSESCNPGNQAYCDKYGLNPCCLSTDPLYHMRQYYPRCEKVKICDIENAGMGFWEKYLTEPLPYIFDATSPACPPTCPPH
jgi:hypothetical protein